MRVLSIVICLIVVASLLAACGTPTPNVVEKEVTKVIKETIVEKQTVVEKETIVEKETVVEKQTVVAEVVITATPAPTPGPAVGGTLVYALVDDPTTLDPQLSTSSRMESVMRPVGGTVLARDPQTNAYIPYLAESYTISDDALTWEIVFKKGIKWHDGTPFTAHDYAWTLKRGLKVPSPATGPLLQGLISAEAVDDYTVRLGFAWPNSGFLDGLTTVFLMPLPQAYVESVGDEQYGRHPIGLGPFKLKEWRTGEKIVLERNPDFNWGPEYTRGGAPFIEAIEFRILPEAATILAGLEAGEIDYASLETKDLERIQSTGQFQIFETLFQAAGPLVFMNVERAPFDDIRVRQALNLAVDRQALINVVGHGHGYPLYGPLSKSVQGYWPGVEYIGYGYDLEKAKALMAEAGYTLSGDGLWEKDGQALELVLKVFPTVAKPCAMLQEQFKDLGISVTLEQQEAGVIVADVNKGNFDMVLEYKDWPDAGILYPLFHSSQIGALNWGRVNDPELDEILMQVASTVAPELRAEWATEAQKRVVEQAYVIPLYTLTSYDVLSNRVKGAVHSATTGQTDFFDAYIQTTTE